jgi:tRNA threonylcarbamoyladenosine biosynthesis protein TsaB
MTAALDARMGEVYWQRFDFAQASHSVGIAIDAEPQLSKADTLVDGSSFVLGTAPTARILLELAGNMLANGLAVRPADAQPLYVRNKVAETTAERAITKANKEAISTPTPTPAPSVIPAQAGIHL